RVQTDCSPQSSALSNQSNYWNPEVGHEHRFQGSLHRRRDLSIAVPQLADLGKLVECPCIGHQQHRQYSDLDELRRSQPAARVLSVCHYAIGIQHEERSREDETATKQQPKPCSRLGEPSPAALRLM